MGLSLKSKLINNIQFTYRDDSYPELTLKEVEEYVRCVDFLEDTLYLSKTGILIIEYKNWNYLYCSPNVREILGYTARQVLENGPGFLLTSVHADDLKVQKTIHKMMNDYFQYIPDRNKNEYKFCFTSRHIRPDGRQITILQNDIFIKWDPQGKPMAKMILFTDISDYKKDDNIVFYITRMNGLGVKKIALQQAFTPGHSIRMSKRELQVMNHIREGHSSKYIADELNLSEHTIKKVRQNILQKLGCENQAQMVKLSSMYGLIPF